MGPGARQVRRAAGHLVPGPARHPAAAGQRVVVQIALPLKAHAHAGGVVQLPLEQIGVGRLAAEQGHFPVPEQAAQRGAGLGVGHLRIEFVVTAKALDDGQGAGTAGDVHAAFDQVRPGGLQGGSQALVAALARQHGHGRLQVGKAHRVAHGHRLPAYGLVLLEIPATERAQHEPGLDAAWLGRRVGRRQYRGCRLWLAGAKLGPQGLRLGCAPVDVAVLLEDVGGKAGHTPPALDERLGQVQVPFPDGDAGELDQGDLDLLVAGRALGTCRAKRLHQQIGGAGGHVEQGPGAGGLVVGDGRFDEVAVAVQFVFDLQVGPAHAGEQQLVVGVQVAVGVLGGADQVDKGVDVLTRLHR